MFQLELFDEVVDLFAEFCDSDLCSAVPCDEDDLDWDDIDRKGDTESF